MPNKLVDLNRALMVYGTSLTSPEIMVPKMKTTTGGFAYSQIIHCNRLQSMLTRRNVLQVNLNTSVEISDAVAIN